MNKFIEQQNLKPTSEMSGYIITYAHLGKMLEDYANQRVVDELEKIPQLMIQPLGEEIRLSHYYVLKRIKELKQ